VNFEMQMDLKLRKKNSDNGGDVSGDIVKVKKIGKS